MGKLLGNLRRKKAGKKHHYQSKELEWEDFDDDDYREEDDSDEEENDDYCDEEYIDEESEDGEYDEEEYEDEEYEDEEYDEEEYDEEEYDEEEYEDEEYDEEEYEDEEYEDEEYDEEEYEDEEYEDEEYEDEEYEDEESEDGEYEEEYEDEESEDEEYDDEEEKGYKSVMGKKPAKNIIHSNGHGYGRENGIKKVFDKLMNLSMVDHIVMFTGVAVLLLAVVTGIMYGNAKGNAKQVAAFTEVGAGVENIKIIGESGLLAITDAQTSKMMAATMEEEEKEANQVDEETGKVMVAMNISSIQKDLKIKFTNENSGKLIPNVNFTVNITGPSGNSFTLNDDDKDGIIYQKDMDPGKYKVSMQPLDDSQEYSFSTQTVSVTVKDKIVYEKVDVKDEIKKESQVNAAKEDTKKNETVQESVNQDTVEWVESTKTPVEGTQSSSDGYEEVDRNNIKEPGQKTAAGFMLLSSYNDQQRDTQQDPEASAEPTEVPAETPAATDTPAPTAEPATPEPTQAPTDKPTPTQAPTEKPTAVPTQSPTAIPTAIPTPTAVPSATPSIKPSVTPTATATIKPSATPTAKATATPYNVKSDNSSNLKLPDGTRLYIKESDGKFREAKYADYFNKDLKFYKIVKKESAEYRYTGWQTLDGVTYYFDKNGNKVTGNQVIKGAKYSFNSDGSLNTSSGHMGIDVSKWNGNIDWNAVRNSGVSYVIIRCGYRGSTTGALIEDPMFKSNIKGASSAGLKVGIYFFTQAVNEPEAVEEASMVLDLIKGYNISYPVFLDVEASGGRADGISTDARTAVCRAFCQTLQNNGYKAGIYANKTWFTSKINTGSLTNFKIWLAQYSSAPTYTATKYDMWQYSSKGSIPGISGETDLNISYMGY